ncbi:hypothetical protein KFL_000010120 [Klebsormidium nitens]|uniref:Uncharacterized protein n=1 Tax=Klebsormidium nitens TaxID=105231 RepID=A0A0U9HT80_KLENI|nr:hypothetical protein KFL_000010120 [Klebsormidium nitens]|eukprot:GAQ77563.1 hypothetical protein KFL_000010120 [Klebsormidium nitens]
MAASSLLLLVTLLAAVSAASAWRPLFPIVQPSVDSLLGVEDKFGAFLVQYGKNYTGSQYLHRLKVFRDNLVKATLNQLNDPGAQHGITQFSDLTEEEFQHYYLGLASAHEPGESIPVAPPLPTGDLPETFDWRDRGAVTPVKNQGMCGSCWAFATTGAIEGAHYVKTGELVSLSEQELVDCDHECDPNFPEACDSGCSGGLPNNALEWIVDKGGLVSEADYPYSGQDGTCKLTDSLTIAAKVDNFSRVAVDEEQIAANLVKFGPLAIGINANYLQTYIGGVTCPLICNRHALNHGVVLVGYGVHGFTPIRLGFKPYWIVKNSWGPHWGEQGYFKICRGKGECGLNTMVSAVIKAE